jgi:hypothetical protein
MNTDLKPAAPASAFPSGDSRPIAVLAGEPSTLAQRFGLCFAEGFDDLDRFRYATVDLGGNCQAWLYKHLGDPNPGTVVRVDSGTDPAVARRELTARLSLAPGDVLWWSSEA